MIAAAVKALDKIKALMGINIALVKLLQPPITQFY